MNTQKPNHPPSNFSHTVLPVVNKTVFRMAGAAQCGKRSAETGHRLPGCLQAWMAGRDGLNVPPLTPELCYRFVLTNPNVHVVLTAPRNREQLVKNLDAVWQGPLNADEMNWIRQYGKLVREKQNAWFAREPAK